MSSGGVGAAVGEAEDLPFLEEEAAGDAWELEDFRFPIALVELIRPGGKELRESSRMAYRMYIRPCMSFEKRLRFF